MLGQETLAFSDSRLETVMFIKTETGSDTVNGNKSREINTVRDNGGVDETSEASFNNFFLS